MNVVVKEFFDGATSTLTYVAYDPQTGDAVVIDPVWDYDQAASKLNLGSVERVDLFVQEKGLNVHYILETHAHADHLSSAQLLKKKWPNARVAIGEGIVKVQEVFKKIFNLNPAFPIDGSQFDFLVSEKNVFRAGTLFIKAISTPGHTPACMSYLIGDCLFTGDALFMPDGGTGRCDFPAASADELYTSVHEKLYALADETKVFVGHDYQPNGRGVEFQSTIGEEKRKNIHLKFETSREDFVNFRKNRDKTLSAPRLLLPSIQVNIGAGFLPSPESNGERYLKIPITSQNQELI